MCGEPVDMRLPLGCGRAATSDHVIPRAQGGSDHRDNLQLAHHDCNQAKADVITTERSAAEPSSSRG